MNEKGQALLIVLLVMTVALTVGLSVATRTVVNVRIATQEEQSQRAFSAAEAGIEETLRTCTTSCSVAQAPVGGFANNTTFTVVVSSTGGDQTLVSGGNQIPQDEGAQVWLSSFGATSGVYNGTLKIYWGAVGLDACQQSALEIIIITGSQATPTLTRFATDPCATRRSTNNFQNASATGSFPLGGINFLYRFDLPAISGGLIMRVIPLYKSSLAGITASSALPSQGFEITSTGTTLGETNPVTRKIRVFNAYPQLPSTLFNYTLFSVGGASLSQ